MTKNVTFYLGPANGLSARTLTIRRVARAGDDTVPVAAQHSADAGAVANVTVSLPDNQLWIAQLVDTGPGGIDRPIQSLHFHTGSLQYLGPRSTDLDGSLFCVQDIEENSSSSSSSSSSISTSSSSSSSVSDSSSSSVSSSSSSVSASTSSSLSSGSSGFN